MTSAVIHSVDFYLPEKTLDNEQLVAEFPDWTIDKIEKKTGIRRRHIAADGQCASDLGVEAANRLFASQGIDRGGIDCLLFCTQSPDYFLPSSACIMQHRLNLRTDIAAFDYNLGCSGYVYGLGVAKGMIETGQASRVLLITADTYSRYIHPSDRSVRTLFGDAGAATLISSDPSPSDQLPGIGPFVYGTDGSGAEYLMVPSGGMRTPCGPKTNQLHQDDDGAERSQENLYMNGRQIFVFTLKCVPVLVQQMLDAAKMTLDDVDLFVFHQANRYILQSLQEKCGIPEEKFFIGMEEVGNTVSCTIPIALAQAQSQGRLQAGNRVMLIAFGVGLSWGATMIHWQ